jgi:hypothetical protein
LVCDQYRFGLTSSSPESHAITDSDTIDESTRTSFREIFQTMIGTIIRIMPAQIGVVTLELRTAFGWECPRR